MRPNAMRTAYIAEATPVEQAAHSAETPEIAVAGQGLSYAPYLHAWGGLVQGEGFATREAVAAAAALLDRAGPRGGGSVYGVEVGPGVVRLKVSGLGLWSDTGSREQSPRGEVVEWSAKSRVRMVRTMCALDWSPVLEAPAGWHPTMLTLTLPGEWLRLAPDGKAWKAMQRAFFERWRRATGQPWAGVWKLEFQRRGAPHVHLYCAAPAKIGVERFEDWLSRSWFEVVGSGDPRHLKAGTRCDWSEGIRASDPKRLGIYFAKRAAGHNLDAGKEYQHRVPEEWRGEGKGPGRFWGYRGLSRCTVDVELDLEQFVQLRRLGRRWARAQGRPVRALETGRVQGGFLLHNDAPRWVSQAARWAALCCGERARRAVGAAHAATLDSAPGGS